MHTNRIGQLDKRIEENSGCINSIAIVEAILREAKQNSRSRIFFNHGCTKVKITPKYDGSKHYLILNLNKDGTLTLASHSLPNDDEHFKSVGTSIHSFSMRFFELLDEMEEFYGQMHTIDELCCVVDPMEISTKHNYRVIKLNDRVYMKIVVDPRTPSSITTSFFGPTKSVETYREMYRQGFEKWELNDDIYRNLLRIFDVMSFPQRRLTDNCFANAENCCICCSYRLGDQIPIVSCDNEKCNLIYHAACLKEWFSTVRDTRTFLNVTSGRCPLCKEKLSTSFAQLLETD